MEVDEASLTLGPGRTFKANFKTTLTTPESVGDKSGAKYKTRLDTIQFDHAEPHYRIVETTLLDKKGAVISTTSAPDAEWKDRGTTGARLYRAAGQMYPFGTWKVVTYRYANGDTPSPDDPEELRSLIGKGILLYGYQVRTSDGRSLCSNPLFESKTVTNSEFQKNVGSPLSSVGISSESFEAIRLVCDDGSRFPVQTLIFPLLDGKAQMLWDGVFLELEREKNRYLMF